jgi:hypothetical protein
MMSNEMITQGHETGFRPGKRENIAVLLLFGLGTLLLYAPVLGNSFLTDDYAALYRIMVEKRVLHEEFLRPLIDISFYFNYIFSGRHAGGYYLFNFCIHILTCYMVYRVTLVLPYFSGRERWNFAWMAGILFLLYPFHNEAVVWLSGRLSSMAALCGLLAVYCHLTCRRPWNFFLTVLFWLVGLFAYESIIVLPAMILLLDIPAYKEGRDLVRAAAAWCLAGIVYLGLRWLIAGTLIPGYGSDGLADRKMDGIITRVMKVIGRCFLPPMENSRSMTVLFVIVGVILGGLVFLWWCRAKTQERKILPFLLPGGLFLVSLAPVLLFGISTRTSEGDRLLYFPSAVLCLIAAGLLSSLVRKMLWRWVVLVVVAIPCILFIRQNNRRWVFASETAVALFDTVRAVDAGRVILVNVADEWEGAYIFRNNFKASLTVNGIDTNKVVVNNYLKRLEYLATGRSIRPVVRDTSWFIYPVTRIMEEKGEWRMVNVETGVSHVFDPLKEPVYYWDKLQLKRLILR